MRVAFVQAPVAFPVYLYGGAGRRRGGVRRIQLSMCKHSSWEPRRNRLFSCPLFLTGNRPLENIGRSHGSPVACRVLCICLLTKYFCVMACVYRVSHKLGKERQRAGFMQSVPRKASGTIGSFNERINEHLRFGSPHASLLLHRHQVGLQAAEGYSVLSTTNWLQLASATHWKNWSRLFQTFPQLPVRPFKSRRKRWLKDPHSFTTSYRTKTSNRITLTDEAGTHEA